MVKIIEFGNYLSRFALEEGMATHSSILPWRRPWTEHLGRLQSMGSQISDTTEWLTCLDLNLVFYHQIFVYHDEVQFSLVPHLCPTLCPMDCSIPGLPVHHQLQEFTQTHVHWVGDAIQPSHPLSSPSLPSFNLSQHQGIFKWVSSLHQVPKVLKFQLQHQSFQWIFRIDFL